MGIKKNLFCLFLFAAAFALIFFGQKTFVACAQECDWNICETNADCDWGEVCNYCFCAPAGSCGSGVYVNDECWVSNYGKVNTRGFNGVCQNGVWKTVAGGTGCATVNRACAGNPGYNCVAGYNCVNNVCVCTPSCSGKSCGQNNGCGSPCQTGTCPTNSTCSSGQCVCTPSCSGKTCGQDGCGGYCGTLGGNCPSGQTCNTGGQCVTSANCKTCASLNYPCGSISDGCGGTLNCSTCTGGWTCQNNQCVACTANYSKGCSGGDVYWYDSCGSLGLRYAACSSGCASGACVTVASCTVNSSKKCDGGNLYSYDSCGNKGDLAQNCGTNAATANYQCSGNWIQQGMMAKDCVNGACTQNQTWNNTQDCSKTGKICKNGACVSADTVPPVLSGLSPSGKVYNSAAVLTVTTNEAADCRYNFWYDKSFDQMTLTFGSSDKIYHSASVALNARGAYNYYIRCRDNSGNASLSSAVISFNYASVVTDTPYVPPAVKTPPADTVPPVLSGLSPSGQITVAAPTTLIAFTTNEKSICKYDIADTDYDSMENSIDTASRASHSKEIILSNSGAYNYFVRCKDDAGNKNSQSAKISFAYAPPQVSGPALSELSPSGAVYQNEVAISVQTDKVSDCRWSNSDQDFDIMTGLFSTADGQSQQATVDLNDYGQYDYYVRCKDKSGNKDTTSSVISFEYKNPNQDATSEPPGVVPVACENTVIGAGDGVCDTAADCVCDPDCPLAPDANADPDCANVKENPSQGLNLMIIIPAALIVIAIVIILIIIMRRKKGGGAEVEEEL